MRIFFLPALSSLEWHQLFALVTEPAGAPLSPEQSELCCEIRQLHKPQGTTSFLYPGIQPSSDLNRPRSPCGWIKFWSPTLCLFCKLNLVIILTLSKACAWMQCQNSWPTRDSQSICCLRKPEVKALAWWSSCKSQSVFLLAEFVLVVYLSTVLISSGYKSPHSKQPPYRTCLLYPWPLSYL